MFKETEAIAKDYNEEERLLEHYKIRGWQWLSKKVNKDGSVEIRFFKERPNFWDVSNMHTKAGKPVH